MMCKPFNLHFLYQGTTEPMQLNITMLCLFNASLLPVISIGSVYVFLPLTSGYFTPMKEIVIIFIAYYLLEA